MLSASQCFLWFASSIGKLKSEGVMVLIHTVNYWTSTGFGIQQMLKKRLHDFPNLTSNEVPFCCVAVPFSEA